MAQRTTPPETTVELTDNGLQLSQAIDRVVRGEARIVVEKRGLPVAAIISSEEYRRLVAGERDPNADREKLYEAFARFSDSFANVPEEELERELEKAQAEVRAELQAERKAAKPE
ncbi:MAG TPA: type II toxin-antitoxin system prevent-host-death family antitoxin [Thermomicrobiales bacterium]|nr:type II toxin-antitoxin system prevent-host-death family antitoxin [Thermomicrobiales bacterium]